MRKMGEEKQLGRECASGGQELLVSREGNRLEGPRPYRRPDLVVYGRLSELTRLDGNVEFDGIAGSQTVT
ncbi:MAG TPA: hypothetical protein VEL74_06585 [Thermoanaerobaculia bacterium]|nr:hypothetical protein [Thermoanaerobaculia bacterium]